MNDDEMKRIADKVSAAEETLAFQLAAADITGWVREHRFHDTRRWRFDFAFPEQMLAVEIEGFNGRHQTMAGFRKDLEKYQAANQLGWNIYRTSKQLVDSGQALQTIEAMLSACSGSKRCRKGAQGA